MKMFFKDTSSIRKYIAMNGYTQSGFAKRVNVSANYLSMILNGEKTPSPTLAKKIADEMGVSISDIFFAEDVHKSDAKSEVTT